LAINFLVLGFYANNKKLFLRNPKFPKDLSVSNAVTKKDVRLHTLEDRMRGLRPRTGIDDEADVADLKVVKDLGATTPVPHEQHLCVFSHVR
jgi:hypothetical protein